MRAAARLLAVLILTAAVSAIAQEKHLIDPTPPGSLNPEPLPPLQNPDAPSTPAKELFARKPTPFPGPPRSIGGYSDGCLAGATQLPNNGSSWQVMRPSRNRNWGNPHLVRFIERFAKNAKKVGWRGLLVGDIRPRRPCRQLHQHWRWYAEVVDCLLPSASAGATTACMKRSCQRHTQVFDFPVRRMISWVPTPFALNRTISARQTCLCGALRSRASAARRRRSLGLRLMEIPVRMRQTRTRRVPPGIPLRI